MKCLEIKNRLHDYIDGVSLDEERFEVERHLAQCASCREEMSRIQALLQKVKTLSTSISPDRDLWPGIETRLDQQENQPHKENQPHSTVQEHARQYGVLSEQIEIPNSSEIHKKSGRPGSMPIFRLRQSLS